MKAYQYIICMILFCWAIANVHALDTLKPAKINQDYFILQTCSDATSINLSVSNSNGLVLTNKAMTNNGSVWVYNYSQPQTLGRYDVSYISDGCEKSGSSYFEVTDSGKVVPDGIIVIIFSFGFLVIIGLLGWLLISNLGHFAQLDYDLDDLIKNVSLYFVLIGFYFLQNQYLGNVMISDILVWVMGIAGFTNVAVSFLAFIFSHTKRVAEQKIKLEEYGE